MSLPALRFSEFSSDWKHVNLGGITKTLTSGSRDWAKYYSKTGSKFIRMTNLSRDGIQLKLDDLKFVNVETDSADGKRTSLAQGDILISITAELGKIGWIPPNFGEAFINQHTALLRLDASKADSRCVAHILASPQVNKVINSMNDAGAKAGLNLPTIKAIKIYLPEKDEQTKIANFLTAVDEKIIQLTKKCELLAQYKKGVMQRIFGQELRFKDDDGQNFPEWREISLKELLDVVIDNRGKTPPIANDGNPLLEVNSIGNRHVNYKAVTKFVSDDTYESWFRKHIKNGDILFSTVGATAQCSYFEEEVTKAVIAQNIVGLRFNNNHNSCFMFYLLTEQESREKFKSIEMVAVQPSIKVSQMVHLFFKIPSIEEQNKIAIFLTAIDDKLTHTQDQLAAAKQYKQGLLQQMFI